MSRSLPRVLIVNDKPDSAELYCKMLTGERTMLGPVADCEIALDAFDAMRLYADFEAKGRAFDLLILDIAMPRKNGFALAKEIREAGDDSVKIVFFTSFDKDIENEARAREVNAVGVWSNTLSVEKFRLAVAAVLGGDAVAQELTQSNASDVSEQMMKAVKETETRTGRKRDFALWCCTAALCAVIAMQAFSLKRAPVLYNTLNSINSRLDGAVSTHALPSGYRVNVPKAKSAFQKLANGVTRVTFEFEAKDAATAANLAQARCAPLYLQVTREKAQ